MAPVELTRAQKQALYTDGFVVLKGIVPKELTSRAKALLAEHERADTIAREGTASDRPNLTGAPEISDLLNESPLTPLLHATMGYFDPPKRAQVAVVHPSKPSKSFRTGHGYPDKDMPYGGWTPHCDGLFGAMLPPEVQAGHAEVSAKYTPQEIYDIIVNAAPRAPNIGRSPDVIGTNFVPLFEDPEMTLSLGSFTALVGVCLNDQMTPGAGQLGLLKGGHHATQRFFRKQRASGGIIGPEGEGWPRFDYSVPAGVGTVSLPQEVKDEFCDESSETTPDGRRWPAPELSEYSNGSQPSFGAVADATVAASPHGGRGRRHHAVPDAPLWHSE
eukprot:COSAG04_NODE_2380_length_4235_cov_1.534333_6_plen_331_part_00